MIDPVCDKWRSGDFWSGVPAGSSTKPTELRARKALAGPRRGFFERFTAQIHRLLLKKLSKANEFYLVIGK
jgi:hypothetical protein